MKLKELLGRIEKAISGKNYPVLKELWLEGKKLSDIAREENITLPAVSYRLKKELNELAVELGADIKTELGSHLRGQVLAPKRGTLLYNLLHFFTSPQRRDLFFPFSFRESGVFMTDRGRREIGELKRKIPSQWLPIREIRKLVEKLTKEGYSPETVGFVIRRKGKRLPLPRTESNYQPKVSLEDIYEELAELQEKVNKVLTEFSEVIMPLIEKLKEFEEVEDVSKRV